MKYFLLPLMVLVPTFSLAAAPEQPEAIPLLENRPDPVHADSGLLGGAFESKEAGIAFRSPGGTKEIHRAGSPDDIVEYVSDAKSWDLKVSRSTLSQPVPLDAWFLNKRKQPGLLQMAADNVKRENANAEILRQDIVNIGSNQVGLLITRSPVSATSNLRRLGQQAFIRSDDHQYYVLNMMSPASPKGTVDDAAKPDPAEKDAVETFNAILDTVTLYDRSSIKEDQDQRLFRTRAFLVNLTENRLKRALIPEQFIRLLRDGKDIGYSYIVEEVVKEGAADRIKIGIRSRTTPEAGTQVDAESWMISSPDGHHEYWTNSAAISDGKSRKDYSTEVGYSNMEVKRSLNRDALPDPAHPKDPVVNTERNQTLNVTRSTKETSLPPIVRPMLPPWYLTQAISHLLPRLLPLTMPKTFLFATYVSEQGEVMSRYMDVGKATQVELDGKTVAAVPVLDRIGLQGSVTTHYFSTTDGKYLGSVNLDSKITLLPSDAVALKKLWPNPNLTRPAAIAPQK